ncbi:N-acetylneuraminate synthase [Roseibium sp. FZY0029]|uniref:N-acetylneuraminate synthase n=1 Tax=Roseibium sp. FZY0029 TaxID=3116647 RepID=UPI002EA7DD6A|nr:N-acetylneuraminate synthase [Roseibium sp. FZY0029]
MNLFEIGGRKVGPSQPCFVIAEIGVNHNGDETMAKKLIDAAKIAGADAVKFQTFLADKLVTKTASSAKYQKDNTGISNQNDLLRPMELNEAAHKRLLQYCKEVGIIFLSSPFDTESVDLLSKLDVPAIKVPSPDCVSDSFLRHIGKTRKPVILSTGMCDLREVLHGAQILQDAGAECIALLHCTSCYPAPLDQVHLRAISTMGTATGLQIGYSDHTEGNAVSIAAVALGATIIEKHITLDKGLPGPDHRASIEPHEFACMVRDIRAVEQAMGGTAKEPQECEQSSRELARRSIATRNALYPGQVISENDLILLRPGTGISPSLETSIIGRKIKRPVGAYTLLSLDDLE